MSFTQKFIVEIDTSEELINDDETDEMAQNIADAIVAHANGQGITPAASEAYVTLVYVQGWYQDKQIIEHP